ncbi:MAG: alpha-L-rhamnosidase N-terminal domain-containing protein [Anaerolineae bacterium]|nr:alpha-L-rhamnosidase N-terminal domain-containing protein [Anaerolineae bacterium]
MTGELPWVAQWIWDARRQADHYNHTIVARKAFNLERFGEAWLRITADSAYRLFINDVWVSDGPCRAWPEHYQYDVVDVSGYLRAGENEICVVAKYWGAGTFHQVPQQPGLLLQLDLDPGSDHARTIGTDATWSVAEAQAWLRNTPKVSIQMEPQELYDARLENGLSFASATVLHDALVGPWQDLHARDVPLLTKEPYHLRAFLGAQVVRRRSDLILCVPSARLAHPGLIEANHNVLQAGGMATVLVLAEPALITFASEGFDVYIDGKLVRGSAAELSPGEHLLLTFVTEIVGHRKEKVLRIIEPPTSMVLNNPLEPDHSNPWCWIAFPEFDYAGDDLLWPDQGHVQELDDQIQAYLDTLEALTQRVSGPASFVEVLGERIRCMRGDELFVIDTHVEFLNREPLASADALVENPAGLLFDKAEATVVHPSSDGDIELVYDLGEQAIGYYDLELIAPEGIAVDIYGVEYINPSGAIQHTHGNRNGLRYITHAGLNRFISMKRRSGRYLFVTLRNQAAPVTIRRLRLIESTYPVNAIGSFHCSDERLTRVWEIAARTLKLCMEDTFTDCPLYEQTLWVGDARNESVFAYPVFGATDIARRCARLAAQSLERYPIVGSQVPTTWDVLLPAWSFLWGISIWDYYAFTGDRTFLEELWPSVIRNLEGAQGLLDPESGLFRGAFWNMFDWSGIDDVHEVVLHNSMLLVGAIDAAQRCAQVLGDEGRQAWLDALRHFLTDSLNRLWDVDKGAYPDSIHEDGTLSDSTSQHTSFLALLYDIIPEEHTAEALRNTLTPPASMVRVGSPFAMMYYYEALERMQRFDEIIGSIYEAYLPMLEAGATTVWEVFSTSHDRPGDFPTRSHCHAWSSAPVYFLNRIILGVRPITPGGTEIELSPRLSDLDWAEGTVATTQGPLHVSWRATSDTLNVTVKAPPAVHVRFTTNDTHTGRAIHLHGDAYVA